MQFTFLDMTGKTLFIRDDAERAQWTQEEMSLDLEFPRLDDKVISIGQRIFFKDPATGAHQIYEVKQAKTTEPDHYQTIVAEHICISELSDEHKDKSEADNISASTALTRVLQGTLWNVGTVSLNPTSSGDFSRGSVWQMVLQIKDNWNVYIEPRVILASDGTITRYLDIMSTAGTWTGVRLSINKNFLDPSVTYDDSEVVTALYGYGGTTTPTKTTEEQKEITFADVVWTRTGGHPAKPKGQTYLEDPDATAAYGRNGRPRFGFYQNTDIEDPNILIQKTWESLQAASKPSISIEGTVADLYRLGYADQPIKLHDIALVEVNPAGYKAQIQIIRMTTDLIDPSATTLTIGSYIPNIVYIERKTNESATGGRGGGGGNKSKQTERSEYETAILKNNRMIMLRAYQNDLNDLDNDVKLQEARITVEHNRITQEVTDRRNSDAVLSSTITQTATQIRAEVNNTAAGLQSQITLNANNITAEVTNRQNKDNELSGRITVEAGRITQIVTSVGSNGEVTAASICLAINNGGSSATINANKIYLLGQTIANTITADYISAKIATIPTLSGIAASFSGNVTASGIIARDGIYVKGRDLSNPVKYVQVTGPDNNVYTLRTTYLDGTYENYTFSRAIASATASWSDGKVHMKLMPQNQTFAANLPSSGTWTRNNGAEDYWTISFTIADKTYSQSWSHW